MSSASEQKVRLGPRRRGRRLAVGLVLVGLAALTVLLLLEAGLRLAGASFSGSGPVAAGGGEPVVLAVGDSFTVGSGAPRGKGYPAQLQALAAGTNRPVRVVNAGVAGHNTTQVLVNLGGHLERHRPAVLAVLVGAGNSWNLVGYASHLRGGGWWAGLLDRLRGLRVYKLARTLAGAGPGTVLAADGQAAGEIEELRRRAWRAPGDSRAARALGLALQESGRPGDGLRWLQRAAALEPGGGDSYRDVGMVYLDLGRYSEALAWLLVALALDPDPAPTFSGLGWLAAEQGRGGEATLWLQAAINAHPGRHKGYADMGVFHLEAGRLRQAMGWFDKAVALEGADGETFNAMARTLIKLGRSEQAIGWLERGIRATPGFERNYLDLGGVLAAGKDPARWREVVQRVTALPGVTPALLGHLRREAEGRGIDTWAAADLGRIINAARARGVRILLQTYPRRVRANAVIRRVARARGVALVDHEARIGALPAARRRALFAVDGHCNARGYADLAGALLPEVGRLLSQPGPGEAGAP